MKIVESFYNLNLFNFEGLKFKSVKLSIKSLHLDVFD